MAAPILLREARRLLSRARFYANVPEMRLLLAFRKRRAAFYRDLWTATAANIGAEYEEMGSGLMRISIDGLSTFVKGYEVMLDSHMALHLMSDKSVTYRLMSDAGVATIPHTEFSPADVGPALRHLAAAGGACVVKPAAGTGAGRGVTTGIESVTTLKAATRYAARFSDRLLIENQIEGHSFRLLYLNGRFVDAIRRDAPVLTGDGRSTVRDLVASENTKRLTGAAYSSLNALRIDEDMAVTLASQGLSLKSRPDAGRVFAAKRVANENAAPQNHVIRDAVHPDTVEQGKKLVARLGLRFAGIDIICRDIAQPLGALNGFFGEVNTTPGLHHHVLVANPDKRVNVAELVLDHIFSSREGAMAFGPARIGALFRPPFPVRI